ncbi:hydrolase [Oligella sp. HMSC05A10]|uniref:HAD-IA family hydrolase n=1 Tax=Oligella sp. HMSC05A10 TaxID=1581112 RepID=UPI0008A3AD64|nr:HAD-IA family hydrolase [Oligella sp. HMSC05A10]OFS89504.1 hydrolase [Oligella sp. HMSC05A10]
MLRTRFIHPLRAKSHRYRAQTSPAARVWFFDLDNTIHDASHAIFEQISLGMVKAVMQHLHIDAVAAKQLCERYWQRYGATMIGMHKHHQLDPEQFLLDSHNFEVAQYMRFEHHLATLLDAVPGTKYVLTNAPVHYAVQVLEGLNIIQCFAGICAINHMRVLGEYKPKPSPALLRQLQASLDLKPQQCVLVEDTLSNLKSAKKEGWQTVYIYHPGTPFGPQHIIRPSYVDLRVRSLAALLRHPFAHQKKATLL